MHRTHRIPPRFYPAHIACKHIKQTVPSKIQWAYTYTIRKWASWISNNICLSALTGGGYRLFNGVITHILGWLKVYNIEHHGASQHLFIIDISFDKSPGDTPRLDGWMLSYVFFTFCCYCCCCLVVRFDAAPGINIVKVSLSFHGINSSIIQFALRHNCWKFRLLLLLFIQSNAKTTAVLFFPKFKQHRSLFNYRFLFIQFGLAFCFEIPIHFGTWIDNW